MIPKLTIGMAHYDDYDGVYFTIHNLRINHSAFLPDVEIIVIDNSPHLPSGKAVEKLCNSMDGVRYVPYVETVGAANSKQRVFQEAAAPVVVVMDCHVMPRWPNFCNSVIKYFESNTDNLIQGPLFSNSLTYSYTHFDPIWRGEMLGIWGSARKLADGRIASVQQHDGAVLTFIMSGDRNAPVDPSDWASAKAMGMFEDDEEFEIPAQGMGLFIARKESWLGFNEDFRGFGGEEYYIHTKYWNSGRKCLCVPKFGWIHRFDRPNGIKYPLTVSDKVRNYVLGHIEVGLPLHQIKQHFVTNGKFPETEWEKLIADPRNYSFGQKTESDLRAFSNLEEIYRWDGLKNRPHTLLMDRLAKLAEEPGQKIIEVSNSRETTISLIYGLHRTSWLVSYLQDLHFSVDAARKTRTNKKFNGYALGSPKYTENSPSAISDYECDTLLLTVVDDGDSLFKYLEAAKKSVRRRIVILNSKAYGLSGHSKKPGFRDTLKIWFKDNPEWFISDHTQDGLGMTTLSRDPEDRPKEQINAWPPGYGVGTALKSLLSKIGIVATPNCSCNYRAAEMDRLGLKWCQENRETILGWLKEEADKRKLPFSKTATLGLLYVAERMGAKMIRKNQ